MKLQRRNPRAAVSSSSGARPMLCPSFSRKKTVMCHCHEEATINSSTSRTNVPAVCTSSRKCETDHYERLTSRVCTRIETSLRRTERRRLHAAMARKEKRRSKKLFERQMRSLPILVALRKSRHDISTGARNRTSPKTSRRSGLILTA